MDKPSPSVSAKLPCHAPWSCLLHTCPVGSDRALNFRGDLAERYNYDKIKPAMKPAQSQGNVVFIEAVSHKRAKPRTTKFLANQWKLLEVLATPELSAFRMALPHQKSPSPCATGFPLMAAS